MRAAPPHKRALTCRYVHSTCSLVAYEYKGPNPAPGPSHGRRVHLSGVGWAHCEKNWGSR